MHFSKEFNEKKKKQRFNYLHHGYGSTKLSSFEVLTRKPKKQNNKKEKWWLPQTKENLI